MLNLLLILPKGVWQALARGEKSVRVVGSICKGTSNAELERVSKYADGMWTLWLYRRDNPTGTKEAGIVYKAGPEYDQEKKGNFLVKFSDSSRETRSATQRRSRTTKIS